MQLLLRNVMTKARKNTVHEHVVPTVLVSFSVMCFHVLEKLLLTNGVCTLYWDVDVVLPENSYIEAC